MQLQLWLGLQMNGIQNRDKKYTVSTRQCDPNLFCIVNQFLRLSSHSFQICKKELMLKSKIKLDSKINDTFVGLAQLYGKSSLSLTSNITFRPSQIVCNLFSLLEWTKKCTGLQQSFSTEGNKNALLWLVSATCYLLLISQAQGCIVQ